MGDTEYSNLPPVIVVRLAGGRYALAALKGRKAAWRTPDYQVFTKLMDAERAERELLRIQKEARGPQPAEPPEMEVSCG